MTQRSGRLQYGFAGGQPYSGYYKHSGWVTGHGVLFGAAAGIATAIVASFIYAYADLYIPIVYANLLITLAFGAAVGFVTAKVMERGKVRNVPVTLALVGVVTALAYYICWTVWICAALDRFETDRPFGMTWLAMHPWAVYGWAKEINQVGTWGIGSTSSSTSSSSHNSNTNGVELLVVWCIEALAIFGASLMVARWLIGERPFCERCDRWCAAAAAVKLTGVAVDKPAVRAAAEAHHFAALFERAGPVTPNQFLSWNVHRCPGCNDLHALSIVRHVIKTDKRGNRRAEKKVFVDKLLVSAAEIEQIRNLGSAPSEPTASPPLPAS